VSNKNIINDFIKAMLHMGMGQASSLFFGLMTASVLARGLGQEGRGTLAMVILLPMTVATFLNMSLGSAVVHFVAKEKEQVKGIVGTSFVINIVLGLLQFLVTCMAVQFAGQYLISGIDYNLVYLSAFLTMINTVLFGMGPSVILGMQAFKFQGYLTLCTSPLMPMGYLGLLFLGHLSVFTVIITNFIVGLIVGIITVRYLFRQIGGLEFPIKQWTKQLLVYGGYCHLSNVIAFFNYRLDMYLLNYFKGIGPTGLYSSAVSISERLWMLSKIAANIIFPKISAMQNEKEKQHLTVSVCGVVFLMTGLAAILFWFVAPYVIPVLLGAEFFGSVVAIQWLLPGIVTLSAGRVLSNDLAGRGKTNLNTISAAFMLVSNVAMNLYLIPIYGIKGAAIATSVSYTLGFVMIAIFYKIEISRKKLI